jgi:hypothetical protein
MYIVSRKRIILKLKGQGEISFVVFFGFSEFKALFEHRGCSSRFVILCESKSESLFTQIDLNAQISSLFVKSLDSCDIQVCTGNRSEMIHKERRRLLDFAKTLFSAGANGPP